MQVPIGPQRTDKQLVEKHQRRQLVNVFAYGQHRCHQRVPALHDQIGHEKPEDGTQKRTDIFLHLHQKARKNEENRHVERIDHLLGVRIGVTDMYQMEADHEHHHDALQVIQFVKTTSPCGL